MARFQAQTTPQLEQILSYLSERLGVSSNKKADLLREMAMLSYWMVYQAERGYTIQAQKGDESQRLEHPLLHQLREVAQEDDAHVTITLSNEEAKRLEELLDNEQEPLPTLKGILERIAQDERRPPTLHWNDE